MKNIKLNNGILMPQIGFGTYRIDLSILPETIVNAYNLGYRQFDTAWRYGNENVIAKTLEDNGIKRNDVFITTKINLDSLYFFGYHYGYKRIYNWRNFKTIERAILESFDNLNTNYIDLFLIHHPYHNYLKMYEVLTRLYKEGRIKAIGVSSFLPCHIKSLAEVSDIVPAVNQFEISPLNTQKSLIKFCQDRGIAVQAMSTFSHFRSNEARTEITESKIIKPIATKYGKSIVQVVLRWLIQQNIIVIPKTWDIKHMKENISIFDFELTKEEMDIIDSMDKGKYLNYDPTAMVKYAPKKYRI